LMGSVEACILNLIYNLADFVNKIAFCLLPIQLPLSCHHDSS
jgi:hypothetical protein